MGGVGHEAPLSGKRRFEPAQDIVERIAQLLELVVGSRARQALVQVAGGDRPGRGGHLAQRAQDPAGEEPAEHGGDNGGHR